MSNSQDVRIERTFNAPIQNVWDMWAAAQNFQQWYGPTGATLPTVTMDVRVGGRRHFCMEMQTPNGPMQMWFVGEFVEIDEPHRLVYTEIMSNKNGDKLPPSSMGMPGDEVVETTVIVELEDNGGGTKAVMTHQGVPADSPGAQGWNMALDKLATLFN